MSKEPIHASDVVREFVNDVKSAHGTGEGDELDRTELASDWPDLLVTYDHALACLETRSQSVELENGGRWQCKDCGRILRATGWTYADLADAGIPICGNCDCEMELSQPPGDSGAAAASSSVRLKP